MKRVLSALIGFPIVILILVFGNQIVIDVAFSAIAIICLHEFYNAFKKDSNPVSWLGYAVAVLIAFIHVIPKPYVKESLQLLLPSVTVMLFLAVIVTEMKITVKDMMITLLGIVYILGFIVFIPMLRGAENGIYYVWYIIFIAWGTDVFAYCIGKKWGKHKFSQISPKKSIEGCIAGIIGAIVASLLYTLALNKLAGMDISYIYIAIVSFALSIISQVGDFAASTVKRYTEIKDYSSLIPGHGGMLDRFDSVIFIAPFAYFLLIIL
ncbi:MAG: phosphatidate cytidylyltransferase [Clostridia bacterium]|nr:phosphatidate cytidylyltransferase [Clostridia bacterium]